jgi:glycosyltransferase involved in cell wall biosynthesis
MQTLHVCLDARMEEGAFGGVQQVVVGLARGLAELEPGPERYRFLATEGADSWLKPYLGASCELLPARPRMGISRAERVMRGLRTSAPRLHEIAGVLGPSLGRLLPPLVLSDGTIEAAGIDVMHFTFQQGFRTAVPSIYQPHDLQHRHHPEYFTPLQRQVRDRRYRALCGQADLVAVMTSWGRADLVDKMDLPLSKVAVVPWASVLSYYPRQSTAERDDTVARLRLPPRFALYPAQTWPHKNHIRDTTGDTLPLVCTGKATAFHATIVRRMAELGLDDQVQFTGHLSDPELRTVVESAWCLVYPSRFEGWGMPILEAFESGLPVACSAATVLPSLAGTAAMLFDAEDPVSIADAIRQVWFDDATRRSLVDRGRQRATLFSWGRTARLFRAHYRKVARRALSDEDVVLLESEPIL